MQIMAYDAGAFHNTGTFIVRRKPCSGSSMRDISEIRQANLIHLRGEERGGQKRLAERLDMSESQISQLMGGKKMGDDLARQIEEKLGLPRGWLDTEYHDLTAESIGIARAFQALPTDAQQALRSLLQQLKK